MKLTARKSVTGFLLVLPMMLGFLALYAVPFAMVVANSATQGIASNRRWVGLENIRRLLHNWLFRLAFANTAKFLLVGIPLLLLVAAMGVSMTGVMLYEKPAFPDAAASVYPLLTCFLPMSMFMMMMNSTYGVVPGIALITMAFAIAYAGDGAAYFGGRALGRHKLCPNVSPKKTVEGAIFGVIGGTLAGLVCRAVFVYVFHMQMPGIPATIALGLIGSAAGEIGDLAASLLKRHSGIKDYGHIFPGHGGVMDRFDSVIFTLIVMYCYTLVL